VNGVLNLLISQHAVNFSELNKGQIIIIQQEIAIVEPNVTKMPHFFI